MQHFVTQCTIVVLLVLSWSCNLFAEDQKRELLSTSSDSAHCKECHADFTHPDDSLAKEKHCHQCHQTPVLHQNSDALADIQKAINTGLNLAQDMRLPLYYQVSKIGDKPNDMIQIPAGEFVRGSNDRLSDEGPQHIAFLPAFLIDKYEVTNVQYKKFIDDTGRRSPKHYKNRTYPLGKADHPVTYVSWYDADAYCKWAGKRLPSDQEWEKAARGTDARTYPWGNEFSVDRANTPQRWKNMKVKGDTSPVGAFEKGKSFYGLHDMSGNVWEWTDSWYKAYPGNPDASNENYGEKYKTLKGGSWWDCSFYKCGMSAPVYNRSFFIRTSKNSSFGFRCANEVNDLKSAQVD